MKVVRTILLFLVLISGAAKAAVIYEWQNLTPSIQDGKVAAGFLKIKFDSWKTGHASASDTCTWDVVNWICHQLDADVLDFRWEIDGGRGLYGNLMVLPDLWNFDLDFVGDSINGSFYMHCAICELDIEMGGNDVWQVQSDAGWFGGQTGDGDYFRGLTGRWVFVSAEPDVFIPAPATLPTFGLALGCAALVLASRRRGKSRSPSGFVC